MFYIFVYFYSYVNATIFFIASIDQNQIKVAFNLRISISSRCNKIGSDNQSNNHF